MLRYLRRPMHTWHLEPQPDHFGCTASSIKFGTLTRAGKKVADAIIVKSGLLVLAITWPYPVLHRARAQSSERCGKNPSFLYARAVPLPLPHPARTRDLGH